MTITYTLNELESVAEQVASFITHDCLLFYGEMGAGKTTLVKALCEHYGIDDVISSPTFSLVNEYCSPKMNVYHFDFYRINDEHEAYDIGFEDYINTNYLKVIEWPERIPNLLPEPCHKLHITVIDESTRKLTIT